jgi:hypothetical protein
MGNLNSIDHLSERELLLLTVQKLDSTNERLDGTNSRLDKLNGSVSETKKRVDELESWRDGMKGAWTMGKFLIGSGGFLALVAFLVAVFK